MHLDLLPSQFGDGIGKVFVCNGIIPALHAQAMRCAEDICKGMPLWRDELKASHFEQLTVGITEIDRIHKAAINGTRVLNTQLLQPRRDLSVSCTGDRVGNMMQVADVLGIGRRVVEARRADEESYQSPIPRIKVQMDFLRHIQVGLLKNKRHTEHTLIKVDNGLTIRTDESEVMNALRLNLSHIISP